MRGRGKSTSPASGSPSPTPLWPSASVPHPPRSLSADLDTPTRPCGVHVQPVGQRRLPVLFSGSGPAADTAFLLGVKMKNSELLILPQDLFCSACEYVQLQTTLSTSHVFCVCPNEEQSTPTTVLGLLCARITFDCLFRQ